MNEVGAHIGKSWDQGPRVTGSQSLGSGSYDSSLVVRRRVPQKTHHNRQVAMFPPKGSFKRPPNPEVQPGILKKGPHSRLLGSQPSHPHKMTSTGRAPKLLQRPEESPILWAHILNSFLVSCTSNRPQMTHIMAPYVPNIFRVSCT